MRKFLYFLKKLFQNLCGYLKTVYNCHKPKGIKLLIRLRVSLGLLSENKFKHSFQNTIKDTMKARFCYHHTLL